VEQIPRERRPPTRMRGWVSTDLPAAGAAGHQRQRDGTPQRRATDRYRRRIAPRAGVDRIGDASPPARGPSIGRVS
jgi:hypothetical protein